MHRRKKGTRDGTGVGESAEIGRGSGGRDDVEHVIP